MPYLVFPVMRKQRGTQGCCHSKSRDSCSRLIDFVGVPMHVLIDFVGVPVHVLIDFVGVLVNVFIDFVCEPVL